VVADGLLLSASDYTVAITDNINAGTGKVTATATAAGNYTGAATQSFTISKASQSTLTINPVSTKQIGDPPFQLSVSGGTTNGAVTYEVISGPGTVTSGGIVTITGAGNIVVVATMAGNDNYIAASSAPLTINVRSGSGEPTEDISIDSRIVIIANASITPYRPVFDFSANQAISGSLYVSAYNAKGNLVNMSSQAFNLSAGQKATVEISIPNVSGLTYKFFIWDSNFIPLTAITSVNELS
jgi:hypothetical protein